MPSSPPTTRSSSRWRTIPRSASSATWSPRTTVPSTKSTRRASPSASPSGSCSRGWRTSPSHAGYAPETQSLDIGELVKSAARASAVFVVLFVVGLLMLGDLLGSFADSDRAFADHFADGGTRARDIVGSLLLVLAGFALVWFAVAMSAAREDLGAQIGRAHV